MENERYKPAQQVLDRLKGVTFVAVIGPSAAGKTTLIREAAKREPNLHVVPSITSRDPRPDEQEGVDFRFDNRPHMEERIMRHEFVQVAPSVFGDLYATQPEDYSLDGVAVMPVLAAALPVFRTLPFKELRSIYVLPPDWETWQARLHQHHFAADKLFKRYAEAQKSLEFAMRDTGLQFVISDNMPAAVDAFIDLALGKRELEYADKRRVEAIVRNLIDRLTEAMNEPVPV